ncbi:MAG: fused response regulator/phosphatase [bacterium]|nr:fused response regulator/phosphatase [bacterium]
MMTDDWFAEEEEGEEENSPLILVADDVPTNLKIVCNILKKEGYRMVVAGNGKQALQLVSKVMPNLILLDVMMPVMNGFEVCRELKKEPAYREIPIIFLTAKNEIEDIVGGFKLGAVDYVTKPFNSAELVARVSTHLELKAGKDEILHINCELDSALKEVDTAYQKLGKAYDTLSHELAEAKAYVEGMLPRAIPPPIEKGSPPGTHWEFQPSSQLGGDIFGYNWLDDNHFSFYLLDVCGHGVGAALLSVSVMQLLSLQTLGGTDYCNPVDVLTHLNDKLCQNTQNNYFFSIWYGVYKREERQLVYSSGGHPPAALLTWPEGNKEQMTMEELTTPGMVVGVMPGFEFHSETHQLVDKNALYVFSDGVYEVSQKENGKMWNLKGWFRHLNNFELHHLHKEAGKNPLNKLFRDVQEIGGVEQLDDDFSLLRICF